MRPRASRSARRSMRTMIPHPAYCLPRPAVRGVIRRMRARQKPGKSLTITVTVAVAASALVTACSASTVSTTSATTPPSAQASGQPSVRATGQPTVRATGQPGVQATGTLGDGAVWIPEYPKSWNGTLILYSHGFGPLTAADAPDSTTQQALLAEGYALAGSSYK